MCSWWVPIFLFQMPEPMIIVILAHSPPPTGVRSMDSKPAGDTLVPDPVFQMAHTLEQIRVMWYFPTPLIAYQIQSAPPLL